MEGEGGGGDREVGRWRGESAKRITTECERAVTKRAAIDLLSPGAGALVLARRGPAGGCPRVGPITTPRRVDLCVHLYCVGIEIRKTVVHFNGGSVCRDRRADPAFELTQRLDPS
ncbi:hypothetical protein EVAR_16250_1 [Eumeta japonica]|uniref:Uncharacterized protein n=1 Tax=Eumeta variegata TaxID=151549 RepID=A0A4C1U5W8_EUMVA|nr:hypothetical protein EVAR_16250_1 [Eumeta japonica]